MASRRQNAMNTQASEQSVPRFTAMSANGSEQDLAKRDLQNLGICASPAESSTPSKRKSRRRPRSTLENACAWIVDRQLPISILSLTAVAAAHMFVPSLQWETDKFFHMQYYNARTGRYGKGWDDMFFVLCWFIAFFGIRVAYMEYLAAPFAKRANIKSRKEQLRFAEQAWILFYDSTSWSLGFYIIYNSVYWMNIDGVWYDWPDRENDGIHKWYYLVQFAFWLQQIAVVNIEERRKDHWQMFSHHLITCALLFGSYSYPHSRIGTVFLCLMDFVDILLALAKVLRYLGYQTACDATFGLFIIGWIVTRHVLYNMVCWNIWARSGSLVDYGCYTGDNEHKVGPSPVPEGYGWLIEPLMDPTGRVCITEAQTNCFLVLLGGLQVLLLMWLVMILKLAYKVITGSAADDPRSDDEEEEEEELDNDIQYAKSANGNGYTPVNTKPIEEDVDAAQMHFRSKTSMRSPNGRASGVQLPVKKELLNRVGCDTKTSK